MTPEMVARYAIALAKQNSEALSFVPSSEVFRRAAQGRLIPQCENEEICGFLMHNGGWPLLKIYQACIQYDARRRQNGFALVGKVVREARRRGCYAISLWCADDLEANAFWQAAGFQWTGQRLGGQRRGRRHNRWVMVLAPLPLLHVPLVEAPGPAARLMVPRRQEVAGAEGCAIWR